MRVFIWDEVSKLTDRCHSGGGLVAVAEDLESAVNLAVESGVVFEGEEPVQTLDVTGNVKPEVFLFPDSGCC